MDGTKLRCFLSLARTLNFTRTAEEVFLTQQAVSRSISSLERELGFHLFQRSTRSVRLTPEGRQYYEAMMKLTGEYQRLVIRLKKQQRPTALHVGYQNFLTFHEELRRAHLALQGSCPELSLKGERYCPPVLRNLLKRHELDMILIYKRFFPRHEEYRTLTLCRIPQYLMVSRDHPVEGADGLRRLRKEPFLIDRFENETPAEFSARVRQERAMWGFQGETTIVPDRDSAYTYAEMGRGVVIGTDRSIMASGRALTRYDSGTPEPLLAVWHEAEPNRLVEEYARALQSAFAAL